MLSPKPWVVVIGMNTQRVDSRRAEEEMENVGAHDNQLPPHEEVAMGDQVPVVPPSMTNGKIREAFITLTQAMTSQDNSLTSQGQAMTSQVNWSLDPSASTC